MRGTAAAQHQEPAGHKLPPEHSKEEIAHIAALLMQTQLGADNAIESAVGILDAAAEACERRSFVRGWIASEQGPRQRISFEEGVKQITGIYSRPGRALKDYRAFYEWWRWSLGKHSRTEVFPPETTSGGEQANPKQRKSMLDEMWHQHQDTEWDPVSLSSTAAAFADWRDRGSPRMRTKRGKPGAFDLRGNGLKPPVTFGKAVEVGADHSKTEEAKHAAEAENIPPKE
jgi:hypothetical protein